MIKFEVSIFLDLLGMLRTPINIRNEVEEQLSNGDDMAFDQIRRGVEKELTKNGIDGEAADNVLEAFGNASVGDIMKCVNVEVSKASVDNQIAAANS